MNGLAAGPWIPVGERLPPMIDDGWGDESKPVLVRYETNGGGRIFWQAARLRIFRTPGEPDAQGWIIVGRDGYDLEGVTHWAEVNL